MRENDVDAMARTHLEPDDTIYRLWTSGRPIMESLEEEERLSKLRAPANDHDDWAAIRDHTAGDLDTWLDAHAVDERDSVPIGPRLVASREI